MNIQQNLNQIVSLAGLLYSQSAHAEIAKREAIRKKELKELGKKEDIAQEVYEDISMNKDYAESTHLATERAEEELVKLAERRYELDPNKENLENIGYLKEALAQTKSLTEEEKSEMHRQRGGKVIKKMSPEIAQARAEEKLIEERKRLMPGHPEAFYKSPNSYLSGYGSSKQEEK